MRKLKRMMLQLRLQGGLIQTPSNASDFIHSDCLTVVMYCIGEKEISYARIRDKDGVFLPGTLGFTTCGRLTLEHQSFLYTAAIKELRSYDISI